MRADVSADVSYKNVFPSVVTLSFNHTTPHQHAICRESILSCSSVDFELIGTVMIED